METVVKKRYLGDAVYADVDERDMIKLTVEYGDNKPTDKIYIEPSVAIELIAYIQEAYPDLRLPDRKKING